MSEFLGRTPPKMFHHHHRRRRLIIIIIIIIIITAKRLTCGEAGMQLLDLPDEDARKATKDRLGPAWTHFAEGNQHWQGMQGYLHCQVRW